MPLSTYLAFDLIIVEDTGPPIYVGNATVKFHDATADVALAATVVSNAQGHVPSGTLPVVAGTLIRARCENDGHGRTAYAEGTTV